MKTKKLILLTLGLLFFTSQGFAATKYCNESISATGGEVKFSLTNVSGNTYRVTLYAQGTLSFTSVNNMNLGVNQTSGAGIFLGNETWNVTSKEAYSQFTTSSSSSLPTNFYANYMCLYKTGGTTDGDLLTISNFNPSDIDWTATCSGGGGSVAVESISLKESTTLSVGGNETLTATVKPDNATNKNIMWSSSNSGIASVVDGVVTGEAVGSATITATSEADGSKFATCLVTVTAAPAAPVFVGEVETGDHSLHIAYTITYNANGTLTFDMKATTDKSPGQSTIYNITLGGNIPIGQFTFDSNKEATLTTSSTFTKDDALNLKFYIPVPGEAIELPFSYKVGADNTSCGTCFQVTF